MQNRRHFLKTGFSSRPRASPGPPRSPALAGSLAEEAPPETTSVRLPAVPADLPCAARHPRRSPARRGVRRRPLRARRGNETPGRGGRARRRGLRPGLCRQRDLSIDAGVPMVMLAGVHPACFELFAREFNPQRRRSEGQEAVGFRGPATRSKLSSASSPPASGSIPPRTSIGSCMDRAIQGSFSTTTRSMRS